MKKSILISTLAIFFACSSYAQTGKIKHMTITVMYLNYNAKPKSPNVFITRDDTAQVAKMVQLVQHPNVSKDQAPELETSLMNLLSPYYNQGWTLVTASGNDVGNNGITTTTLRYYLVKKNS